jgi:hypothetical protein
MTAQRQIGKTLLRRVWMLVAFVRTEGIQSFGSKDSYDRAEYIRLFEVQVDKFPGPLLDVLNGPPDVNYFQAPRQAEAVARHRRKMRR